MRQADAAPEETIVTRKYDLEDIDDDDPAYEMLGSKYSRLIGRTPRAPHAKHRDDVEERGRGHDERRVRRQRDRRDDD